MNKKLILSALLVLTMNQQLFAITLSEANQLALQNDPNWKAAQQRYDAQKQNLSIAKSGMRTQVDAVGNAGVVYGPNINGNVRTGVAIEVSKPLYNSSEKAKIEKAKVLQNVYEVELEIAREAELIKVTTAYLQTLEKQDIYKLATKEAAIMRQYAEQAKTGADVNVIPRNAELDFKAQLDSVLSTLLNTEMDVNSAKIDLETIVGVPVNSLDTNLSLNPSIIDNTDKSYWLTEAREGNLKLQQLRFMLSAADYNVKEKSRMYRPVVTGVASVGTQNGGEFGGYGTGVNGYVGVQVRIPLGGRAKSAQTTQARSEQDAAMSDQQAQELQISQTITRLLQSLSLDQRIISAKKQMIKSADEALKMSNDSYRAGQINSVDLLAAHKNFYAAKKELISAKYLAAGRVVQLLQVAGMLTIENIERVQRLLD